MTDLKYNKMPDRDAILSKIRVDFDEGKIYRREWHHNAKSWEYKKRLGNGYKGLCILGVNLYAHRLIYFLYTGIDPVGRCIDHINGDVTDNRPENLRMVDLSTNSLNRSKAQKNSVSGVRNVHYCKKAKKYLFTKQKKNTARIVERFDTLEAAARYSEKINNANYGDIK